jgi:hypothetical protein
LIGELTTRICIEARSVRERSPAFSKVCEYGSPPISTGGEVHVKN